MSSVTCKHTVTTYIRCARFAVKLNPGIKFVCTISVDSAVEVTSFSSLFFWTVFLFLWVCIFDSMCGK